MTERPDGDQANGYEANAAEFIRRREHSTIGSARVRLWARGFRPGAAILELGAGFGEPVTRILVETGLAVSAIDASLPLVDEFRRRFPGHEIAWERIEDSALFGRQFEGVIAIGLVFLLAAAAQRELVCKVALALEPRGRFLFTAPVQPCGWTDVLTGRPSVSLGQAGYSALLDETGFDIVATYTDEGENNYYDCRLR